MGAVWRIDSRRILRAPYKIRQTALHAVSELEQGLLWLLFLLFFDACGQAWLVRRTTTTTKTTVYRPRAAVNGRLNGSSSCKEDQQLFGIASVEHWVSQGGRRMTSISRGVAPSNSPFVFEVKCSFVRASPPDEAKAGQSPCASIIQRAA